MHAIGPFGKHWGLASHAAALAWPHVRCIQLACHQVRTLCITQAFEMRRAFVSSRVLPLMWQPLLGREVRYCIQQ